MRGQMTQFLSVSQVARLLNALPRDISDLFYARKLRDDICPIVAGRRLIPKSYIHEIEATLRKKELKTPKREVRRWRNHV